MSLSKEGGAFAPLFFPLLSLSTRSRPPSRLLRSVRSYVHIYIDILSRTLLHTDTRNIHPHIPWRGSRRRWADCCRSFLASIVHRPSSIIVVVRRVLSIVANQDECSPKIRGRRRLKSYVLRTFVTSHKKTPTKYPPFTQLLARPRPTNSRRVRYTTATMS